MGSQSRVHMKAPIFVLCLVVELSLASYINVNGTPLQSCSSPGMALTGYTREGNCVAHTGDAGSHHVCIDMSSNTGGNFCTVTGPGMPEIMPYKVQCVQGNPTGVLLLWDAMVADVARSSIGASVNGHLRGISRKPEAATRSKISSVRPPIWLRKPITADKQSTILPSMPLSSVWSSDALLVAKLTHVEKGTKMANCERHVMYSVFQACIVFPCLEVCISQLFILGGKFVSFGFDTIHHMHNEIVMYSTITT